MPWLTLLRFWYIPVILLFAALWWERGVSLGLKQNALTAATQQLSQAQRANAENNATIVQLNNEAVLDRKLTEQDQERVKLLEAQSAALRKELENAPNANDTVNPFFDYLGDSLRNSDTDSK